MKTLAFLIRIAYASVACFDHLTDLSFSLTGSLIAHVFRTHENQ